MNRTTIILALVLGFAGSSVTAQESSMFRNFANQVFSGKLDEGWPMWALKTQQVMDACLEAAKRGTAVRLAE